MPLASTLEKSYPVKDVSALTGIHIRTVYRDIEDGVAFLENKRMPHSELVRYAKRKGAIIPDIDPVKTNRHTNGNTANTDPVKSNGKRYDVDELINRVASGDPLEAKVAKDQAQALKTLLEVQKRRKEDGELISIDQYRVNIARLGQKVRNLANSIADGFLGEIDGMTAPQIHHALEIRIEEYCKRLSELEWEEDEAQD